ncbi:glutathione peroxidase [Acrasis kona]|uniref:Glutathione peroxidase n=1 Tax=Acrasis kona TaxID=1008807 RepID=A0AAW2YPF1_9EUKA
MTVYDYKIKDANKNEVSLEQYRGKVLLIVNVASKCGNTPQYKDLQLLQEKYQDKGFQILAFPCNQFMFQEPGDEQTICEFATSRYNVTFPIHAKIHVNGSSAEPLFDYLKKEQTGVLGTKAVKWNFTKFLVDRNGIPIKRYSPNDLPLSFEKDIATACEANVLN